MENPLFPDKNKKNGPFSIIFTGFDLAYWNKYG
jgi:hypothetical protein